MDAYPLYGATFAAYRLSPLLYRDGDLLAAAALRLHARRLGDRLKGDTLRGVHVGLPAHGEAGTTTTTGPLEECTWELIGDESSWAADNDASQDSELARVNPDNARGIHIQLRYEKVTHSALLLRDPSAPSATPSPPTFCALPLLLVRLPVHVREIFLDYLSTSFDARVAPMRLRSSFLASSLEDLLTHFAEANDTRPVQIQLTFPAAGPALKNLDVTITAADVPNFLALGKRVGNVNTSTAGPGPSICGPFTSALSVYLQDHIALTLENPGVLLSKVACGPIALAGEGKVKLLAQNLNLGADDESQSSLHIKSALQSFYTALLKEATRSEISTAVPSTGQEKLGLQVDPEEGMSLVDTAAQASTGTKLDDGSMIPTEPPPPYELHDPARRRA